MSEKKKGRIGCLPLLILLIFLFIIIGGIKGYFDDRAEQKAKEEAQQIAAEVKKKKRQDFLNTIDDHYGKLTNYYERGAYNAASDELSLFKKYRQQNYKNVRDIEKKIRIHSLDEKVKNIPASRIDENLKVYEQLLSLDPENPRYQQKVEYYTARLEEARIERERREMEEKKELERQRKARADRIARFGEPPENSAWDGSVRCVKDYLELIAKDPDSLKYERWGKVSYNDNDGWLVWCDYRGKNSFGGYVRNINWFVIRHNRVVEMKDFNAYRLQ